MNLFVKILAFISQMVVLVLLIIEKQEYFAYKNIQFVMIALNGLSITCLFAPDKFNDDYQAGYRKIKTIDNEKDLVYTEHLGWKGVLFLWIGTTIGSFLVAIACVSAFRLIFFGYSCLFLIVNLVCIIRQIRKKNKE